MSKERSTYYDRTGFACPLCGGFCDGWETCVLFQNCNPARQYNPDDYVTISNTRVRGIGGIWTPEMVTAAEDKIMKLYPFMTRDDTSMAHILSVAAEVSAKAGGSAGSGAYSKFIRNCQARHAKHERAEAQAQTDNDNDTGYVILSRVAQDFLLEMVGKIHNNERE